MPRSENYCILFKTMCVFYASFVDFFFNMGGSVFFFVESKTFEFSIEEGGMFYQLRIQERGKDSLRTIFMGKGSAKRLLLNVEELISGQSRGQFAKSFHEGDKCFILQLRSNTYDSFLLISKLIHSHRKGSIVVPEGKSGSGWRGFGLHLQPRVSSFQASNHRYSQKRHFKNLCIGGGRGKKGKNKTAFVQNSNPRDTCTLNKFKSQRYLQGKYSRTEGATWGEDFVNNKYKWN